MQIKIISYIYVFSYIYFVVLNISYHHLSYNKFFLLATYWFWDWSNGIVGPEDKETRMPLAVGWLAQIYRLALWRETVHVQSQRREFNHVECQAIFKTSKHNISSWWILIIIMTISVIDIASSRRFEINICLWKSADNLALIDLLLHEWH